jgi:hypothetical protein
VDKRVRSPNYPAISLPEALDKVSAIYRAIHNHAGPRAAIAKAMGYMGLNGASATAISALHKYGLLERSGDDVKVSDRALRILHPHSPAERAQAIKDAGAEPPLFAKIAERFPGHMPNQDLLRNYLMREGFSPGALAAVISAYQETSEMVERENGVYQGVNDHIEEPTPVSHTHTAEAAIHGGSAVLAQAFIANERPIGRYDYEGGAYVRIAASGDIDTEEALDMVETLIQLKRAELKRKNRRTNSDVAVPIAAIENDSVSHDENT